MNIAFYSYLGAALSYAAFSILLVFSWRASVPGKLLFITALTSSLWALFSILLTLHLDQVLPVYQSFEILRYVVWYIFLLKLFENVSADDTYGSGYKIFARRTLWQCAAFSALLLANELAAFFYIYPGQYTISIIGGMALSLIGLAVTEQLYRNAAHRHFWAIKFLLISVTVIFAYDFYLYTDALLFRTIDQGLWAARGIVHIIILPMLVIAAARNNDWSLNLFVSRDIILGSSVAVGGSLYLLLLTVAGYYMRELGGDWGELIQISLTIAALVFLIIIISSANFRARARVFLGKHFYKNKYDYRVERLRLTDGLRVTGSDTECYNIAIKSIARIVNANAGLLWLHDESGSYRNVYSWNSREVAEMIKPETSVVKFFSEKKFIVNLLELESHGEEYDDLSLPVRRKD